MNINATLIGQTIAFFIFVWFCMKYIWPPIMSALNNRKQTIADGLAAGERGKREQQLAEERVKNILAETKGQVAEIIARAEKRGGEIIEEAKEDARAEGQRILAAARADIKQEINSAKEVLRAQVSSIAIVGASKILEREVDAGTHGELLSKLASQI